MTGPEREDTIRESLNRIEDKLDHRLDKLADAHQLHTLEDERRFGRIDKLLVGIAVAVASPKIGGPDVANVVADAIRATRG